MSNTEKQEPAPNDNMQTTQKEDRNFKFAFIAMSVLLLIVTCVLVGIRFIGKQAEKQTAFYETIVRDENPDVRAAEITQEGESTAVNVNTASLSELTKLPGIGEAKAKAIIEYRDENGPYTTPEDLKRVKGIGDGILEKIRPYICFFEEDATE